MRRVVRQRLVRLPVDASRGLQDQKHIYKAFQVHPNVFRQAKAPLSTRSSDDKPIFAISEAFVTDEEDLEEQNGDVAENFDSMDQWIQKDRPAESSPSNGEPALEKRLQRMRDDMEKKKVWMQKLKKEGKYSAIVQAVYDCYAPLYSAHPALASHHKLGDRLTRLTSGHEPQKYQPKRYDDMATQMTEQEAMALLVQSQQGEMAVAVVRHRQDFVRTLDGVLPAHSSVLPIEQEVDIRRHLRTFYSFAVSAFLMHTNPGVALKYYEKCVSQGILPTASMNATYLKALIDVKNYKKALKFGRKVKEDGAASNMYFYRLMLKVASICQNTQAALDAVEEMRMQGYRLRPMDYWSAVAAFDTKYYLRLKDDAVKADGLEVNKDAYEVRKDQYRRLEKRLVQRENNPEKFEKEDEATEAVLHLYDQMQEEEVPLSDAALLPRLLTACVLLNDLDRVPDMMASAAEHMDHVPRQAIRMGVNAYLFRQEPQEAIDLFLKNVDNSGKPQEWGIVLGMVDYLVDVKDGIRLVYLVRGVSDRGAANRFQVPKLQSRIINTICADTRLTDEIAWQALLEVEDAMPVRQVPQLVKEVLVNATSCGRLEMAKTALNERDVAKVKKLRVNWTKKVMKAIDVSGDGASLAYDAFEATDIKSGESREDVEEICHGMILACGNLGDVERARDVYRTYLKAGRVP